MVTLDDLLARARLCLNARSLTAETSGMCDAAFFAKMQRHAIFVNTAVVRWRSDPRLARR